MSLYRHQLFPRFYDFLMGLGHLDERRSAHLSTVRGKVLEVGIGTGRNLPYYPEQVTHITGLDNNPGMLRQLRTKRSRHELEITPVLGSARRMPFGDDSFDTIVSTHSLCSITDRKRALLEIRRVLKPDGRFVFLEHGRSPDEHVAKWQSRLNGIQKQFAVGCVLDMQVDREIQDAGFECVELHKGYHPRESKTHGYLYEGVAVISQRDL